MIEVRTLTLTILTMANPSTTATFRGGKMLSDAATTSSAERLPLLIACWSLFPVGFNPVVFILLALLVLLVPIVVYVFMMMAVDNRNGECQLIAMLLRCTVIMWLQLELYWSISHCFLQFPDPILLSKVSFSPKVWICAMQSFMCQNWWPKLSLFTIQVVDLVPLSLPTRTWDG